MTQERALEALLEKLTQMNQDREKAIKETLTTQSAQITQSQQEAYAQITQSQQDMQESCKSHARAMQESLTILETNTQESNPNTTLTTQKLMTKKQQRMAERS